MTYFGEIKAVAFPFAPRGWALCNGQILPVHEYTALFSLIGNIYGGDGKNTFALPDLRGRVAIGSGAAPTLTDRAMGDTGGSETISIGINNLPMHSHTITSKASDNASATTADLKVGNNATGDSSNPSTAKALASLVGASSKLLTTTNVSTVLKDAVVNIQGGGSLPKATDPTGANFPLESMPPFLGINYIICLGDEDSVYPQRG